MTADSSDGIAIDPDWWDSGWNHLLPRQALFLHMVVATATMREIDGSFDTLVELLGWKSFDTDTGGLDGPVWWSLPDQDMSDTEQLAMDAERQQFYESVLAKAGRIPPQTVRQLAALMADLGVFEHEVVDGVERWRSPQALPLVADRLPLPAEAAAEEDRRRWRALHEHSAQELIRHVVDHLDCPEQVQTTLAVLASEAGMEIDDLRFAIAALIDDGDFSLVDPALHQPVDPETLPEGEPAILRIDWDRFNENRMHIQFGEPDSPTH